MTRIINETAFSKRYQIRPLTLAHLPWAKAIYIHANTSPSSIWPTLEPGNQTALAYRQFDLNDYLFRHVISSGMSFGVFDTEYEYRFRSSAKIGGQLHWDMSNEDATWEQLLQQMDFPLVSIALSYDAADPPNKDKLQPLQELLPVKREIVRNLEKHIPVSARDSYKDAGFGKVLMRRGTATRGDYEGRGIMKRMAWWLMAEAKRRGYEIIEIPAGNVGVRRIWENPPGPFRATLMGELVVGDVEVIDEDGRKTRPYEGVDWSCCQLRIDL